jgi:hypothetical protein
MEYEKQDLRKAEKEIRDRLKSAQFNYAIWNTFRNKVLPEYDGKEISKRIATATQKIFPHLFVTYNTDYNMYHINIYKQKKIHGKFFTNFDKKTSIMLGHKPWQHNGKMVISTDKVEEHNQCYELEKGRAIKYKAALPKIKRWVKVINKHLSELEFLSNMMKEHELQYLFTKKR